MSGRKLQTLLLKRKIELIEAVEKMPAGKKKDIAAEFGIVPNTLSTILKDKEKYRRVFYGGQANVNKQRQHVAAYNDIDEAILRWFSSARLDNVPISGPILTAKAESIAEDLGHTGWKCSAGWIDRFKKKAQYSFREGLWRKQSSEYRGCAPMEKWYPVTTTGWLSCAGHLQCR
jgi:hypothetical protein